MKSYSHQHINTSHYLLTTAHYRDFTIPPHFHKNYEMILCLAGRADVAVNGIGYELNEGECILVNCYQIHGFTAPEDGKLWVTAFSPTLVKSFHAVLTHNRAATTVLRLSEATKALFLEKMIPLNDAGTRHFETLSMEQELNVKACLYAVCGEYMQCVTLEKNGKDAESVAFEVIRYIAENFRDNITLQTAAEYLRYNYHYLSKVFNRNVGYSFNAMLNQYRLEYAVQLLEETETPITQIAFESGFQSQRTFNRIFEDSYKVPPREYRKTIQKKD